MTYRLHFTCPRCNKASETTQLHSWPLPEMKCGDCLINDVEVVAMKCVGVERTKEEVRAALTGPTAPPTGPRLADTLR